jgi:peptidylprolyl isomerase
MVRLALSVGILAASLSAQSFDPKMPAAVPPAPGAVVESAPLRYIDVQVGSGAPAKPGQEYTVHYTGWLRDGSKFDSSVDAGKPFKFVQGRRQVIAGWEMAFEGMKVGGKRRLFLPYALAYGENGRGKIPPKAELIFDVELLDVKDVPPLVAAAELLTPFDSLEKQVLALAKAIPEEKYAWRPSPGVRSFKEVFLHIVNGNQLLLNVAEKSPSREELLKQVEQNAKGEQDAVSKEKIVAMLTESFAGVRKTLQGVRSTAALTRDVDFFGTPAPMGGVLATIDTHIAEHLGQAIAYARVNGIVPPWSQPAQ